jgi:hypothetical protein
LLALGWRKERDQSISKSERGMGDGEEIALFGSGREKMGAIALLAGERSSERSRWKIGGLLSFAAVREA